MYRKSLLLSFLLLQSALIHAAAGNPGDGKLKAQTCQGCHGVTGYNNAYPNYPVPKIHGQNQTYLITALNAYKKGERKHPTMGAQSQSLTDQDIADIAAYLSSPSASKQ